MAGDDLDLSEFEEFSSTAKRKARAGSPKKAETASSAGGSSGRRRWPWLLTGLVLGGALAVFGPDLVAPYLPTVLQQGGEEVRGPVVAKRTGNDRVLLTVDTERGALLATFRQRVPEIDLLVEEGDTVTLGIPEYAPLVEDPVLAAVRKGRGGGALDREGGAGAVGAAGPGAETPEGADPVENGSEPGGTAESSVDGGAASPETGSASGEEAAPGSGGASPDR